MVFGAARGATAPGSLHSNLVTARGPRSGGTPSWSDEASMDPAMHEFQFLLNPPPTQLARCSAILCGRTNGTGPDYRVSGYRTTLTLKAVTRGCASYWVSRARYRVTEDTFLI